MQVNKIKKSYANDMKDTKKKNKKTTLWREKK